MHSRQQKGNLTDCVPLNVLFNSNVSLGELVVIDERFAIAYH